MRNTFTFLFVSLLALSCAAQTRIFLRTQLKYGLERTDYIHAWYERPLYQDSTFAERAPNQKGLINDLSWRKQVEMCRMMKCDGFGVLLGTAGREAIIGASVRPGCETTVLVELTGADQAAGMERCLELAGKALAMPNAFRLDGRVVLTRYPSITVERPKELDFWPEFRKALDARYGADRFVLMPYVTFTRSRDHELRGTPAADERTRENIRGILRRTDGLYYTLGEEMFTRRRYERPDIHDDVVVPLVRGVLAEPEFRGRKYLGMGIRQGHENDYRWCYGIDSTGTKLLRDSMASVARMKPDFVLCPEWDEQNENTHFRPLVSDGYVTARTMRYWADVLAGRTPDMFPGDDPSVPNLIVSYRKSLIAGEPIEVEVVHVPDGTAKGRELTVAFGWKTPDGRTIRRYPPRTLSTSRMDEARFVTPSVELAGAHHVLLPELKVTSPDGSCRTFGAGMWPMALEANRSLDFKWAKHALRDLSRGVTGSISVGPALADGTREVRGRVRGTGKFRSIEVLDNFETVYMHDPRQPRKTGIVPLRVGVQGCVGTEKSAPLDGFIRVAGQERRFAALEIGPKLEQCRFDVPEPVAETAAVEISLAGLVERSVPVREVLSRGVVSLALPKGITLAVAHDLSTPSIPPPCGTNAAEFVFRFRPMDRASVIRLRTVGEDYRTWVSPAPVDLFEPSGRTVSFHVAARTDEAEVSLLTVDAARCAEPSWTFDPPGTVFRPEGHFGMPAVVGGSVAIVNGYGWGGNVYGNAIPTAKAPPPHPRGYATLPLQTVPMFAGFELVARVRPDDVTVPAAIFSSGVHGLSLEQTKDGVRAWLSTGNRHYLPYRQRRSGIELRGPALRKGEWNDVRVFSDKTESWVEVNGVRGDVSDVRGWQFGPLIGGLGVTPGKADYFPGEIRSLSVRLR